MVKQYLFQEKFLNWRSNLNQSIKDKTKIFLDRFHVSNMHHNSKDCGNHILLILLFFSVLYIFFSYGPAGSKPLFPLRNYDPQLGKKDALDVALAKTATENKTVIIAMVNQAYVEGHKSMLEMFLDGFWLGEGTRDLLNHLLLVTVDQTSFDRCRFLQLHCYRMETDGMDFMNEDIFMSPTFIDMMWRRTLFLGEVLRRGYNIIFTDTDVIWLRNPFPRLSPGEKIDLQISTDKFNGDQWSEDNPINTGFYMIYSNNKTIALFDSWYARKDNSTGMKEQDVLESMMRGGVFQQLGVQVRILDTLYFSGFCHNSKDIKAVITVHANCCRTINAKIADLTEVIQNWKRFKRSGATNQISSGLLDFRHEACLRSWN